MPNLIVAEEHMLGPAEPDSLRPKCSRLNRVARNIRIGANLHFSVRVRPLHEPLQFRIVRLGRNRIQLAFDYAPRSTVKGNPVTFPEDLAFYPHRARFFVDCDLLCPSHAALSHAAGYDRCVTSHASARSEDALGDFHAVNVFRSCLRPYQNHRILRRVVPRHLHGFIRGEDNLPDRRAGGCG